MAYLTLVRRPLWRLLVALGFLCGFSVVEAASHVWSGANGSAWSDPANWSSGGAPSGAESDVVLSFPSAPASFTTVNDLSSLSLSWVTISADGYAFSGNAVSLAGYRSIRLDLTTFSSSLVTWGIPLVLGAGTNTSLSSSPQTAVLAMTAPISGGGDLSKDGWGHVRLTVPNSYTGSTLVNAGTLDIQDAGALGDVTGTTTVFGGAVLSPTLSGGGTIAEPLILTGGQTSGGAANLSAGSDVTWAGPISFSDSTSVGTFATNPPSTLTLSGPLSGSGARFLGNVLITGVGDNPYSGFTNAAGTCDRAGIGIAGPIWLQSTLTLLGACKITGNLTMQLPGQLKLAGTATETIPSLTTFGGSINLVNPENVLTLGGDWAINGTLGGSGSTVGNGLLDLGSTSHTFHVSAGLGPPTMAILVDIVGSGALTLDSTGILLIEGTPKTFSGTTTIQGANLRVHSSMAQSNVMLLSGTLSGSSSVGNLVASGGSVSPGGGLSPLDTPGILSAGPNVSLGAGSSLVIELNGTAVGTGYDRFVGGTITLGANLVVTLGYTPTIGDTFTIVQASSSLSGTFSGLPEGATICVNATTLQVHYTPTTVMLTATAQPDTTAPEVTAPAPSTLTQTACS